jgi:hypothetical protein
MPAARGEPIVLTPPGISTEGYRQTTPTRM